MEKKIKVVKTDEIRIYIDTDPTTGHKLDGIHTTNRNVFWLPKLINTIEGIVEDYEDRVDTSLTDLWFYLKADKEIANMAKETPITHHELFRPYQNTGATLLQSKGSFGLFWEQRTGKTPTTCLGTSKYDRVIIAVPAGLELTWKHEYMKWTGREDVFTLPKAPKVRKELYNEFNKAKRMILIGSSRTLAKDMAFKHKKSSLNTIENEGLWLPYLFDALVLDEAHFLRNKTQHAAGITKLRGWAKNGIALTGTPATNGVEDVLPILGFITNGKIPKWPFVDYFLNKHNTRFGVEIEGVKHERQREWVELLDKYSQQLKMKDVNSWVPEVVESTIYVAMTTAQKKYYNELLRDFRITNEDGEVIKREENRLTQISSLIRIGLAPDLLDIKGVKSGKTVWLKEYLGFNRDKPLIIAANSTSYLKHLDKELFDGKALKITGEQSASQKTEAQRAFQAGESNVILLNTQAGATGWTLDRADTTIFVDISWNPTDNKQLASRMMSSRQENVRGAKEIIYLQNENSIDDLKRYAVENKLSRTEIVNNFIKWLEKEQND